MVGSVSKKKKYYAPFHQKKKGFSLEAGQRGFLCTSNFHEPECVREAYNLLNDYADRLYPDTADDHSAQLQEENEQEMDISDALHNQIEQMKPTSNKKHRFFNVMTNIRSYVFIKTELENPVDLAMAIIKDVAETKEQKTRYLTRLIPIEVTCGIKMTDIVDSAGRLFDKHFLCQPTTFSIVFNKRCSTVNKDEVISQLHELVKLKNLLHKADLTNPEKSIIVEVIKSVCLMSVVPHYRTYKKFNLLSLCSPTADEKQTENSPVDDEKQTENSPVDDEEKVE